ncbi:MAG: hypothetical protein WAN76_15940, partial [Candidatus Sulfotelmatobacter sp.]
MQKGAAREAGAGGVSQAVRESGAGSHSIREMASTEATTAKPSVSTEAAPVTATKPSVATEVAPVAAAKTTTVTSASALRQHGDSQEKRERRDGHQATHT